MADGVTIGFVGAGRMATALARGFIRSGLATREQIIAADTSSTAREHFGQATGAAVTTVNREVLAAPTLVIAVKPAQVIPAVQDLREALNPGHLILSIAAGVRLNQLQSAVPAGVRVVRVMPNTPALVGASATAYARAPGCTPEDGQWVQRLLASIGIAFELEEGLLDAVTGLSGSGPAYAFLMIEALSDGGVAAGLPRDIATRLAAQTLFGAAKMVLETGQHPGVLKDQVTSPGGTTIEGLHEIERGGVRGILMQAVRAATARSRSLGQP